METPANLTFTCDSCGSAINVPDDFTKPTTCAACGAAYDVKDASQFAEPYTGRGRPSRKDSPLTTYLWEDVPRQLLNDAKLKSRRERTSIKAVLIEKLRDWTYAANVI